MPEKYIADRENKETDTEAGEDIREEVGKARGSIYENVSSIDFTQAETSMKDVITSNKSVVDVDMAHDLMDSKPVKITYGKEEFTMGVDDAELVKFIEDQKDNFGDIMYVQRRARVLCKVKTWGCIVSVVGTLVGVGTLIVHILKLLEGKGGDIPPFELAPDQGLSEEGEKDALKMVARWQSLGEGEFWGYMSGMSDRQNPSLQGQVLMMSLVKMAAAPIHDKFVWKSGADKAAAVKSCLAAYKAKNASHALYDFIKDYRYQGHTLPRQIAADVVELAIHQLLVKAKLTRSSRLHFPDQPATSDARIYAGQYLPHTSYASHLVGKPGLSQILDYRTGPLPVLDPDGFESLLASLEPEQRDRVQEWSAAAIANWRRSLPLLPNEELTHDRITALTDPWNGNPASSLVYHRLTDRGQLAVVAQGSRAETVIGKPAETEQRPCGSLAETPGDGPPPPAIASEIDIVKQSLNTLGMISYACGPGGAIIGSANLALATILNVLFPPQQINLVDAIDKVIKQDLANDHIQNNMTTLLTYTTWWSMQAKNAQTHKYTDQQSQAYKDTLDHIKQEIDFAIGPNSSLQKAVTDLRTGEYQSTPEFQLIALPVFMLGASTHLAFLLGSVIYSTDATTVKSPKTVELVNYAKLYKKHVEDSVDIIQKRWDSRMKNYTPYNLARQSKIYHCDQTGMTCADEMICYWIDDHGGEFPKRSTTQDPDLPGVNLAPGYQKYIGNNNCNTVSTQGRALAYWEDEDNGVASQFGKAYAIAQKGDPLTPDDDKKGYRFYPRGRLTEAQDYDEFIFKLGAIIEDYTPMII
ncbi:hypothetical protein ACFVUW_09395 [Streptomyces xiamenensis]|uniref:hypothetical protein n=1 Tax=Streptomyces xiamenensis TaxID=408015 RepID=UPI0036EF9FFC